MSDNRQTAQTDYSYEDDFEEADTVIQEKSQVSSASTANNSKKAGESHKRDLDSQPEKGQRESSGEAPTEKEKLSRDSNSSQRPPSAAGDDTQSDDSEVEAEDDPPEYDVKERVRELNEQLAMEPDPNNRQHRVGFKSELVDLVAPPPEVSEDEEPAHTAPAKEAGAGDSGNASGAKKKDIVVERNGKFEVVNENELTAEERALYIIPDNQSSSSGSSSSTNQNKTGAGDHSPPSSRSSKSSGGGLSGKRQPAPPAKPRPSTANSNARRVKSAHSPRPQTAGGAQSSDSFTHYYSSTYTMSPSEKERAQEKARLREEQKREEEIRRKQEEEEKRRYNEECFQAWLQRKQERKQQQRQEQKKKDTKDDRSEDSESDDDPESKENEEAYKGWLKTKQQQVRKEKLLKKREEQEIKDGYYIRSQEECNDAYKAWLKKKYAEIRKQKAAEKQRVKAYRLQARKLRKQQQMARAVTQTDSFKYVDYYGYRF